MKKILSLIVLVMLIAGCSEAPFDPDYGASVVIGSWRGVSKITYPGPVDEPITEVASIDFHFSDDGSYSFREQYDYDTNSDVVYTGSYQVNGSMITLTSEYIWLNNSPLDLSGIFHLSMDEGILRLYQEIGDEFPVIHEVTLNKWVDIGPSDPEAGLLGQWWGWSHVTYPNEVDAPIHDSLEVNFKFYTNHKFTYGWVGDEISYPTRYEGIFETHLDKIYLIANDNLPYNSPLNLQGEFVWTADDSTLRLLQHPEHIWPTIHEVLLTSTHSVSSSFGQRRTPSHDRNIDSN